MPYLFLLRISTVAQDKHWLLTRFSRNKGILSEKNESQLFLAQMIIKERWFRLQLLVDIHASMHWTISSKHPCKIVFDYVKKMYSFCSLGSEKDIEKSQRDCQIVCDAYEESSRPCSNKTEQLSLSLSIMIIIVINWIINKWQIIPLFIRLNLIKFGQLNPLSDNLIDNRGLCSSHNLDMRCINKSDTRVTCPFNSIVQGEGINQ